MSQKTNPTSLRLRKSNKLFSSCWYSDYFYNQSFDYDLKIRSYIENLSGQIGHLQMFSFLQSHYKRAYIYLFFLDMRSIREERERSLKILHKGSPSPKQKMNSFLSLSPNPHKERDSMFLEKDNAPNVARHLALGFANSFFGTPVRKNVEVRETVTRQATLPTKQVQKLSTGFSLQTNKAVDRGSVSEVNKDLQTSIDEATGLPRASKAGHGYANQKKAFLQLQQGSIYSLFRQNLLYTCLGGMHPTKMARSVSKGLPKIEQVCLPFLFAQEQRFCSDLTQDLKDLIKHKEDKQNLLFCLFPKKDLKQLPLRLLSFGPLCALTNFKKSFQLANKPIGTKTSIYKAKQANKTHKSLGSAYAYQDFMEVSMSQTCSQKKSEHLVERQLSKFLLNSHLRHFLFLGDEYLKRFKKSTIAVAARFPWLSLVQGLQIQNARSQDGLVRHQFVSIYPVRVVKDAQSSIFIVNEIVHLLQKSVPFRKIRDQILRELASSEMVKGIRFSCSGRVGGRSKKAQKTKTQSVQWGETSLHVFSSKLSFAKESALTPFGKVGVKVWVCYK